MTFGTAVAPSNLREVVMTHSVIRMSAITLGVAALVSLTPLSAVRADMSAASGTTSATGGAPSTGNAAASTGSETPTVQPPSRPNVRHSAHHYARHYVSRHGHRYVRYGYRHNSLEAGATAVAGGIADLGSVAAYPIYCFPNYGSCPIYLPY